MERQLGMREACDGRIHQLGELRRHWTAVRLVREPGDGRLGGAARRSRARGRP